MRTHPGEWLGMAIIFAVWFGVPLLSGVGVLFWLHVVKHRWAAEVLEARSQSTAPPQVAPTNRGTPPWKVGP